MAVKNLPFTTIEEKVEELLKTVETLKKENSALRNALKDEKKIEPDSVIISAEIEELRRNNAELVQDMKNIAGIADEIVSKIKTFL